MTTATEELEREERKKFVRWFKKEWHPDKTGPYVIDQLWFAYRAGWQARAKQESNHD